MLHIHNLTAGTGDKTILNDFTLDIAPGEIHAIMGPNGTGKSTLSHVIAGKPGYEITSGTLEFRGEDLTEKEIHERAAAGIFLAFQYPAELEGVSCMQFLKSSVNAIRNQNGLDDIPAPALLKEVRALAEQLGVSQDMLKRSVNSGFSGGEKKRFEALQLALLKPSLAILDETDSGLDVDALKSVADAVNNLRSPERSFLIITHYKRLLDYIVPDVVHIMDGGKIITSGGPELADRLEKDGYKAFAEESAAASNKVISA